MFVRVRGIQDKFVRTARDAVDRRVFSPYEAGFHDLIIFRRIILECIGNHILLSVECGIGLSNDDRRVRFYFFGTVDRLDVHLARSGADYCDEIFISRDLSVERPVPENIPAYGRNGECLRVPNRHYSRNAVFQEFRTVSIIYFYSILLAVCDKIRNDDHSVRAFHCRVDCGRRSLCG